MNQKPPTIGRIVHFTMPGGQRRPAIVTAVNQDVAPDGPATSACNLHVFTDGANEGGVAPHQRGVLQGEDPGTWCWPQIEAPAGMIARTGAEQEMAKAA